MENRRPLTKRCRLPSVAKRFHRVGELSTFGHNQNEQRRTGKLLSVSHSLCSTLKLQQHRGSQQLLHPRRTQVMRTRSSRTDVAAGTRVYLREVTALFGRLNQYCQQFRTYSNRDHQNLLDESGRTKGFNELHQKLRERLITTSSSKIDPEDLQDYFERQQQPRKQCTLRMMKAKARRF